MKWLSLVAVLLSGLSPAGDVNRYVPLVDGVLSAWKSADVVCLGEDHGRKKDSDLRLALVRDPRFPRIVRLIVVEMANGAYQDVLDRFTLDGVEMSRDELSVVWRNANGPEVWESPIYEEFLRAVRETNRNLPKADRIRVIAGDTAVDWTGITTAERLAAMIKQGLLNRSGNIRDLIAKQALDRNLKALAIYGGGHCVNVAMGFPGELADKYPGRLWSVSSFVREDGAREGKQLFGLGSEPQYIVVRGTKYATMPAGSMFIPHPNLTIGDNVDAVVWYGDTQDIVVRPDVRELNAKYGAEFARRNRLMQEAMKLVGR
jgi:hypothetical protein